MKHSLLKVVAGLCLAVLLAGCNDLGDGTMSGDLYSNKCKLNVTAVAEDQYGVQYSITGASSGRTLLPIPSDLEGSLTFEISGSSSNGYDDLKTAKTLTFTDKKTNLELRYDVWELTLSAKKDGKVVLKGTTKVDLSAGGTEVKFTLTSKGITDVTGNIAVSGTYVDASDIVDHASAVLKNFNTNEVVKNNITIDLNDSAKTFALTADAIGDLNPGVYYLILNFYNDSDKKTGTWGDIVYVDPGNTTTRDDIEVTMETLPDAPDSLKAYLVDSSKSLSTYNVKVVWNDNSTNEDFFVLKIKEYKDDLTEDSDNPYYLYKFDGDTADDKSVVSDFYNDILVSGSMLAGHEDCVITLPTGRLFDIEVAAVNTFGMSDYYSARADSTGDAETGCTGFKDPDTQHINLFYIMHRLNGGTLTTAAATTSTADQLSYYNFKNADDNQTVMEIKTTEGEFPRLVSASSQEFKGWYSNSADAASDTDGTKKVTANTKFHNLEVIAGYDPTCIISYTIKDYTDIANARVIALYSSTSTFGTDSVKNKTITYDDDHSTWNVRIGIDETVTTDDDNEYVTYSVIADGTKYIATGIAVGTNFDFEAITTLGKGTHVINVIAVRKSDGNAYSNTFAITINK